MTMLMRLWGSSPSTWSTPHTTTCTLPKSAFSPPSSRQHGACLQTPVEAKGCGLGRNQRGTTAKASGKAGVPDAAGRERDRASPQAPGDQLSPPPRGARGERAVSVVY